MYNIISHFFTSALYTVLSNKYNTQKHPKKVCIGFLTDALNSTSDWLTKWARHLVSITSNIRLSVIPGYICFLKEVLVLTGSLFRRTRNKTHDFFKVALSFLLKITWIIETIDHSKKIILKLMLTFWSAVGVMWSASL